MPHGQTKFNSNWLCQKDESEITIGECCKADQSCYSAYCTLCCKGFQISNSGFKQVISHSKGKKHQDLSKARFGTTQRHFSVKTSAEIEPAASSSQQETRREISVDKSAQEAATQAELLWTMKVASSNFSYSSCDDVPQLFQRMFPCDASRQFTLSRTKVSYLVSDGLGPFFRKKLCENVCKSTSFVLQFDETGTCQNKKQCDILLRYWSVERGEVVVQFLKALFFHHALGHDVAKEILNTLQEEEFQIPISKFLNIGSDGPNVNKTIWNYLNDEKVRMGLPGLMQFIPCNLHVAHNAFKEGLSAYGSQAEELAIDVFYYFRHFPCRRDDFAKIQDEVGFTEQMFIRHIQCRWLTLIPAVLRVVKNWDALKQYFITELPKSKSWKQIQNNEKYIRIVRKLNDTSMKVELVFLIELEPLFNRFLKLFQKEEPLIHLLHEEMVELIKSFMRRFLKVDSFENKSSSSLVKLDITKVESQLSEKQVEFGEDTRKALSSLKSDKQKMSVLGMMKFYKTVVEYLQRKLPINSELLQDLKLLHPLLQKEEKGVSCIRRIAKIMPQVISSCEVATVTDEWKIYMAMGIPKDWIEKENDGKNQIVYHRIDYFWNKVLQVKTGTGDFQFKLLAKLIRSALCLAHGNAEVERSLSENKRTVTCERSLLSESSLNGLRMIKDTVNTNAQGKVHLIPISTEMKEAGKHAYQAYNERLREEKEAKERTQRQRERERQQAEKAADERKLLEEAEKNLKDRKRKLEDQEKQSIKAEKELSDEIKIAEKLLKEGNDKLTEAIKKKNFEDASVAQAMIEAAQKRMQDTNERLKRCLKEREEISLKRRKVMDEYSKKLSVHVNKE